MTFCNLFLNHIPNGLKHNESEKLQSEDFQSKKISTQNDVSLKNSLLKEIDFYLVTDSGLSKKGTLSDVKESVKPAARLFNTGKKTRAQKR